MDEQGENPLLEKSFEDKRWNHFNVKFLPAKITSYSYFGAKYLLMTYLVPFFTTTGLHPTQAGIIISIRYMAQVIGGVLLSYIADRTKKYQLFSILGLIMTTLTMVVMPFGPYILQNINSHKVTTSPTTVSPSLQLSANHTTSLMLTNSTELYNHSAPIISNYDNIRLEEIILFVPNFTRLRKNNIVSPNVNSSMLKSTESIQTDETLDSENKYAGNHHHVNSKMFYLGIICCVIYAVFDGSLNGLIDCTTISTCNAYGKRGSYYWQRLWGSVGYATVPLIGGILLDQIKYKFISPYLPVFILFYSLQIVALVSFIILLRQFKSIIEEIPILEEKPLSEDEEINSLLLLRKTLTQPEVIVCLLLQVFFGIGTGIEFSYLQMYMKEYMINGTNSVLGFAILSQCLIEAVFAPVVGKLNSYLKDPFLSMAMAMTGYCLGFLFYYYTNNAIYIIIINFVYGISYLMFNFPAQTELYRLCPKQCLAVVFSLSASCYTGIGCAIGGLLGGILYEKVGPRNMYLMTSIVFSFGSFFLFGYCAYRKKCEIQKERDSLVKPVFV